MVNTDKWVPWLEHNWPTMSPIYGCRWEDTVTIIRNMSIMDHVVPVPNSVPRVVQPLVVGVPRRLHVGTPRLVGINCTKRCKVASVTRCTTAVHLTVVVGSVVCTQAFLGKGVKEVKLHRGQRTRCSVPSVTIAGCRWSGGVDGHFWPNGHN